MDKKSELILMNEHGDFLTCHSDKESRQESIKEIYHKYQLNYTVWTVSSYRKIES